MNEKDMLKIFTPFEGDEINSLCHDAPFHLLEATPDVGFNFSFVGSIWIMC